jgi:Zn-dependent protease with chaperone function
MHLTLLLLVVVLIGHDASVAIDFGGDFSSGTIALWSVMPTIVAVLGAMGGLGWCRRRLLSGDVAAWSWVDRIVSGARAIIVLSMIISVLGLEWLTTVRSVIGDHIVIDELIVLGVPITGVLLLWWFLEPVDRVVAHASMLRRLDEGLTVHAHPTRWAYVMARARLSLFLVLGPLVVLMATLEGVEWIPESVDPALREAAVIVVGAVILVVSPLWVRWVLNAIPLPDGPVREAMEAVCSKSSVPIRELLLWPTGYSMINAAVVGFTRHLRFVLLSDQLIAELPARQLIAVMAHEVAHAAHRHLPWLLATVGAAVTASAAVASVMTWALPESDVIWVEVVSFGVIAFAVLGWVSGRFERQADTFAVQHLCRHDHLGGGDRGTISPQNVETMCGALDLICELNGVNPRRRSWRHGPIAWRQAYLRGLVGSDGHAIDRLVFVIKIAVAVTVAAGIVVWLTAGGPMTVPPGTL